MEIMLLNYTSLKLQSYEFIKNQILCGKLNYDTVYSESKIAKELSISKTPVRDAVQYLSQEKYVDIIPNKGFCLHKMNEQDFIETCEIRSAIEGYCSRKISIEYTNTQAIETINELSKTLEYQKNLIDKSVDDFFESDIQFHLILVNYVKNKELASLLKNYRYRIKNFTIRSLANEGRLKSTYHEHLDIYEQIKKGDHSKAYESVLFHIDHCLENLLKVISKDN